MKLCVKLTETVRPLYVFELEMLNWFIAMTWACMYIHESCTEDLEVWVCALLDFFIQCDRDMPQTKSFFFFFLSFFFLVVEDIKISQTSLYEKSSTICGPFKIFMIVLIRVDWVPFIYGVHNPYTKCHSPTCSLFLL